MAWAVVICAVLTAGGLFYVFSPLIVGGARPFFFDLQSSSSSLKLLLRKKETIYENIKDLEFEYKMGKLSEEDYQRLRDDYSREAFEIMTRIESLQPETLAQAGKPQVVAVLKSGKKSKKPV
jgi:hypothetical protein